MSEAMILALVSLVEEAVKNEPAIAAGFQKVFSNPNPAPADWQAMRADVLSKKYKDYVPDTALQG